jgi:hypothetical protein
MEHASIAAFARFTLQLMHLGAPLPLLEGAQRAMRDETEHTKLCFGIASALLQESMGPGCLSIEGALTETTLEQVLRLVVYEGCIGETIAAMEAAESLALAQDPQIREALAQIEQDERRHSELAWQFVQWALSVDTSLSERLRNIVADEIQRAQRDSDALEYCVAGIDEDLSARYGVLPRATRHALHQVALREVIEPCARELLRSATTKHRAPAAA